MSEEPAQCSSSLVNDSYREEEEEAGTEGDKEGKGEEMVAERTGEEEEKEEEEGGGKVSRTEGNDKEEVTKEEKFSDVNIATPLSELPSLEFFDHNLTSSDSSGGALLVYMYTGIVVRYM